MGDENHPRKSGGRDDESMVPIAIDAAADRLRRVRHLLAGRVGDADARESLAELEHVVEILGRLRARHAGGID